MTDKWGELLKVFDTTPEWITHLRPRKGDLLIVRCPPEVAQSEAYVAVMKRLANDLGVYIVYGFEGFDVTHVSKETMREHGWVPVREGETVPIDGKS